MRMILLLHRWTGGLIGLILVLLGITGTLLLHADQLFRPTAGAVRMITPLSDIAVAAEQSPAAKPDYIIFSSGNFPFHRVVMSDGSGRYLDNGGAVVSQWQSLWERPELWLFDLHRYLLLGHNGETIVGICALLGIGFVVTGTLLWWQHRRTFAPRFLPARLSRPAILRHHRDLGILIAPFLLLSFVTGAAMALKPVGRALVSPWSSASEIKAATAPPAGDMRPPAAQLDWAAMFADAKRRFPEAELRLLAFPRKAGDPILFRMRQRSEWLPNGRTNLWYSAHDGHLIEARDVRLLPKGLGVLDLAYPLHAAKVGGLIYRLVMTISGVGLTLLGSFAMLSFWVRARRPSTDKRRRAPSNSLLD